MAAEKSLCWSAMGLLLFAAGGTCAVDLTTFSNANVEARYTTSLGIDLGDTIGNGGQGLYDYANNRGNGDPWWHMNDGDPFSNINTWGVTDAEDFVGYQFKLPASISEINFSNKVYVDGGTFLNTPRVEVLRNAPLKKGGYWETIPATWNTAYDGSFIDGHRQYTITPNVPTGNVWGVRLIGAPAPGTSGMTPAAGSASANSRSAATFPSPASTTCTTTSP
jgi:hypothetical protein